jgi:hypothetical protein
MDCILRSRSCLFDTRTPSDPYPTPSLPKGSLYPSVSAPEPLSGTLDHSSCLGLYPLQYLHPMPSLRIDMRSYFTFYQVDGTPSEFPILIQKFPALIWTVPAVETQFSTGWYWPILRLNTTGLHNATSPSCTQDTFPRSRDAFPRSRLVCIVAHLHVSSCIFAFHRASLRFTAHLRISPRIFVFHRASSRFTAHLCVLLRIFAFHRDLVRIITGASIHCPASSFVCRIPFITISDYVWHRTISISLWTLTLHHLHT